MNARTRAKKKRAAWWLDGWLTRWAIERMVGSPALKAPADVGGVGAAHSIDVSLA
jgi:hypothetical protein